MTGRRVLQRIGSVLMVLLALVLDLIDGAGVGTVRASRVVVPFAVVVGVTTAVYASLLLRFRRPVAVVTVLVAFGLLGIGLPHFLPFVGLVLALHAVGACVPARKVAVWCLAASTGPMLINAWNGATYRISVETPFLVSFAGQFGLHLVVALAAWGVGRLSWLATRRADERRMRETEEALRRQRLQLARELHDSVAHAVGVILMQAAGAATLAPPQSRVEEALKAIEQHGVRALVELREMLIVLNEENAVDSGVGQPSIERLDELVAGVRATGLDVRLSNVGTRGILAPAVSLAAYRILQETLTNAIKHGSHEHPVEVAISWTPRTLEIDVRNTMPTKTAAARAPVSSGFGFRGLRERVEVLGGLIDSEVVRTAGEPASFRVHAELPRGAAVPDPTAVAVQPGRQLGMSGRLLRTSRRSRSGSAPTSR